MYIYIKGQPQLAHHPQPTKYSIYIYAYIEGK